jgi:hypothetical protein
MCYHTHYIFLACGHSASSLHPIRPSPPCPSQQQYEQRHDPAPAKDMKSANISSAVARSARPFSFEPSIISSPLSPRLEPIPTLTPWRLEEPFSTPESASSIFDGDVQEDQAIYRNTKTNTGMHKPISDRHRGAEKGQEKEETENTAYKHCGHILLHPYHSYKVEGLCLRCLKRRDTLLANFEVNAIRDSVYRESVSGLARTKRRFGSSSSCAGGDSGGKHGTGGDQELKLLSGQLKQTMPMSMPNQISMSILTPTPTPSLLQNMQVQVGMVRVDEQQQQTPWRLTLPPAEVPKFGWGLAGMRPGEWI